MNEHFKESWNILRNLNFIPITFCNIYILESTIKCYSYN